jgi:hypothetical protein
LERGARGGYNVACRETGLYIERNSVVDNPWSKELGKAVFEGNRRWLQRTHPHQMHPNALHLNGKDEMQTRPHATTIEQLRWVRRTENWVAAGNSLGVKGCPSGTNGMQRECALFDLPYWEVSILIQLISSKLSEKYCLL